MELFKRVPEFPFVALRRYSFVFSAFMLIVAVGALVWRGLNLGLDFTGGAQLEVECEQAADVAKVRESLAKIGELQASVQAYGSEKELMIRTKLPKGMPLAHLQKIVLAEIPQGTLKQISLVGGQAGRKAILEGALAVAMALIGTLIYIMLRFEWRFAVSASLALLHDPLIILGYFALSQREFDLVTLVAILTIIGYSINNTIVIYDRVRENFRRNSTLTTAAALDLSINQTLARGLILSGTTLASVVSLLLFGGQSLRGFSLALFIGIVAGTYSSIYLAGPLAMLLGLKRKHLAAVK